MWIVYFAGTIDWNTVESCPTYFGVEDVELKELADALKILHVYCDTKDWNEDDFISVFEELTGAYYTALFKNGKSFNHVRRFNVAFNVY